ncbi:hypothetical protein [Priestia aryabhattai]|uniref:hypothetical protein n=1 Tax=Priestia aryabhattai TaxID=412384 RepID=UPI0023B1FA45|nr:hypothetical protein [Priestia aryabhattai]MDE8674696.1 hypothetical protein [Priestia aryabhattai]
MKFLKIIGFILFIVFVVRFFIGGPVGENDLGKIAEKKAEQQAKENPEVDKIKIVHTSVDNKKRIINATVVGLPQDEADFIEVEVATRQTSKQGIETDENYRFPFYQLVGEKEWKFAREVDDSGYGFPLISQVLGEKKWFFAPGMGEMPTYKLEDL